MLLVPSRFRLRKIKWRVDVMNIRVTVVPLKSVFKTESDFFLENYTNGKQPGVDMHIVKFVSQSQLSLVKQKQTLEIQKDLCPAPVIIDL